VDGVSVLLGHQEASVGDDRLGGRPADIPLPQGREFDRQVTAGPAASPGVVAVGGPVGV